MANTSPSILQRVVVRALFVPSLVWNLVLVRLGYRRFYDRIDSFVLLGALPVSWIFARFRHRERIGGVLSVNEDYEVRFGVFNRHAALQADLQHLQLRVIDYFAAPSLQQVEEGVEFMRRVRNTDTCVYVHCKAGRSRSSCVVACYLMRERKMSAKEAVAFIKERRPHIAIAPHHWALLMRYESEVAGPANERMRSSVTQGDA